MKNEQHLKNCFSLIDEFYKRKKDLIDQLNELSDIMDQASIELHDSIDNGISKNEIEDLIENFHKNRFKSAKLKDFMHKVVDLCFGGFDKFNSYVWKNELNLIDIELCTSHVILQFNNRIGNKHSMFDLSIPVQTENYVNITKWHNEGYYIVDGYIEIDQPFPLIYSTIAKCFDPSKILEVIDDFLKGKYDDEIKKSFNDNVNFTSYDESYCTTSKIIDIVMNNNLSYAQSKEHCIENLVTDEDKFKKCFEACNH